MKSRQRPILTLMFALCALFIVGGAALAQTTTVDLPVVMADANGEVSLRLPEGWIWQDAVTLDFLISFVFGDSEDAVAVRAANETREDDFLPIVGNGGLLAVFDPAQITEEVGTVTPAIIQGLMNFFVEETLGQGGEVVQRPVEVTYAGLPGMQAVIRKESQNEEGMITLVGSGTTLIIVTVTSPPGIVYANNAAMFAAMLDTLSVPAEAVATTLPDTTLPDTGDSEIIETITEDVAGYVRSAGDEVSLMLPEDWLYEDLMAEVQAALVWGDTEDAVQTRIDDLTGMATTISGNGGMISLVSMDDLGLTALTADSAALLDNVLGQFAGSPDYLLEEPPTAFTIADSYDGHYAIVTFGSETGHLAVIVFDAYVALVTSTGTPDTFTANRPMLMDIMLSIRVPAAPPPERPAISGLGGLLGPRTSEETSQTQLISNTRGNFEFEIPVGWVADVQSAGIVGSETIYIGSNDGAISYLRDGTGQVMPGAGGILILMSHAEADPGGVLDLDGLFDESLSETGLTPRNPVTDTINGLPAKWANISFSQQGPEGYWIVIDSGTSVALIMLAASTEEFPTVEDELLAIVQSARFSE